MRVVRIFLVIVGLLALGIGVLVATDPHFSKIDFTRFPSRAAWQHPERVLETLGVAGNKQVADLGAGDGYFVDFFSGALGAGGRLYAVDVDSDAIAKLERKVSEGGHGNVEVIEGSVTDAGLPDGEIDLVFLCNVYHHIDDQVAYFDHLRGDLSPEGRIAIVEGRPEGFGKWVSPAGHATPYEDVVAQMEEAGYGLDESHDFLPIQNLLVFRPLSSSAGL